uniref:VWFA domain-containing protein n=1 Tax=Panagrellus redivivus TaxID=6233 RepID=A0A7E4V9X1_PANRE
MQLFRVVVALFIALIGHVNADTVAADGVACANVPKKAWLDIAVIIQTSAPTTVPAIMLDIVSDLSSCLYQLNIGATGDHNSRVALITYDGRGAVLRHGLTDKQTFNDVRASLKEIEAIQSNDTFANMAAGLRLAMTHLNAYPSYRIQAYVVLAATYDTYATDYPFQMLNLIKQSGTKVATIAYTPSNGVFNPKIGQLASPGLDLSNHKTPQDFGRVISLMNCRCLAGQTQLVINETIYAECFTAVPAVAVSKMITCPNHGKLITAQTRNRYNFITKVLLPSILPNVTSFNVDLVRAGNNNNWNWDAFSGMIPYDNIPNFDDQPSQADSWGYLAQNQYGEWGLYADDGNSAARQYICASRACDASYKC